METQKAQEILKMAILMEKRGHAFYAKVAEQTPDPEIKHIFLTMADEETKHVKFLSEQYISFEKNNKFTKVDLPDLANEGFAALILNEDMKSKISSAGFEAAAISAAIDFEKRAIAVYSNQAELSDDPNEKDLYRWLAEWEGGHLKILSDMDNELKEKIWNDNQFWPF
ncbi:MAG: ferritin family protein [Bacteroidales bacterium]|nr:ferritin family protein [Bacteroidales bacterium]